jgi:transcriptional regulator with XRE-family HTH domain
MKNFYERLKKVRNELGYTQKQVADGIGITETAYQNYESGRRIPVFENVILIADFFNCSLDWLIGRNFPKDN